LFPGTRKTPKKKGEFIRSRGGGSLTGGLRGYRSSLKRLPRGGEGKNNVFKKSVVVQVGLVKS